MRFFFFQVRVITSLVTNIDKKSEVYPDDLSRIVFQMNNLRYILTDLKRYLLSLSTVHFSPYH